MFARLPGQAVFALLLCALAGSAAAARISFSGTVLAQAQAVAPHYRAYARVRSVAVTTVNAVEAGTVTGVLLPGERVKVGQVLAILSGSQAEALLLQRRGALHAAALQLAVDRRKLAARLVTRQAVAVDQAAYDQARGRWQVALQTLRLRAPADGEVLRVEAADGEQVAAGEPILTLQTGRSLLEATYYGADAFQIHPGMTGEFRPVSAMPVPVRVLSVVQALRPDGGEHVWLRPVMRKSRARAAPASWRSGQWGTVTVNGPIRPMVAVPSRALILDRAQWWVLVRTAHGTHRQRVALGPSRGWTSFVTQGLKPGEHVVVQNAYLEFFHGIATQYTPAN